MNNFFFQLRAVPLDVWYIIAMLFGVFVCAVFVDGGTPKQALSGLFVGIFGGGILILLLKWKAPDINPFLMGALSALSGLAGNWAVHFLYNRRDMAGGFIDRYLKAKYGQDSTSNPSTEDK